MRLLVFYSYSFPFLFPLISANQTFAPRLLDTAVAKEINDSHLFQKSSYEDLFNREQQRKEIVVPYKVIATSLQKDEVTDRLLAKQQKGGEYVTVELESSRMLDAVGIDLGEFLSDFPVVF